MRLRVLLFTAFSLNLAQLVYPQTSNNCLDSENPFIAWGYGGFTASDHALFGEVYRLGDTYTKNGKEYRMLHIERSWYDGGSASEDYFGSEGHPDFNPLYDPTGCIGIREDAGRILVDLNEYKALLNPISYWSWEGDVNYLPYEQSEDGELVLYDFTKQEGDKFVSVKEHEDIYVVNITELTTRDGIKRHVQTLSNGCKIVEGIGCTNSTGMWLCYLNPVTSPCKKAQLNGAWKQNSTTGLNELVFWREDYEEISSLSNAMDNAPVCFTQIFDLQGRRLTAQPQSGLYIRSGKKYVVK